MQKARGVRGHGVCTGQKTFSCDQSTSYVGDSQLEKQAHVREKVLIKGFVLNPRDSKQVSNLIRVALGSCISQRWLKRTNWNEVPTIFQARETKSQNLQSVW